MTTIESLGVIKRTISLILPDSEVILFGSRAKGEEKVNSDFDLLIISEKVTDNSHRLHYQSIIRRQLAEQNILADIIVQSRYEIPVKRKLPGHIVKTAIEEGIIL